MDILFLVYQWMPIGFNVKRCNKTTNEWSMKHYDWKFLSKCKLPDYLIEECKHHIIYRHLHAKKTETTVMNPTYSEEFVQFVPYDYFEPILMYQQLSENFFNNCKRKFSRENWSAIWTFQNFSEEFILNNKKNWENEMWIFQSLSEHFLEQFVPFLPWDLIFKHQKLSEKFVIKYLDKVESKQDVYIHQCLSDDFYLKYKWEPLLVHKKTSDQLIKSHVDILDIKSFLTSKRQKESLIRFVLKHREFSEEEWNILWLFQKVSTDFILEFRHKIANLEMILWSQDLSINFVEKIITS